LRLHVGDGVREKLRMKLRLVRSSYAGTSSFTTT
jgi:hypothetical protein